MILQFPDLDTLTLVLRSGVVPPELQNQPIRFGMNEGKALLEPQGDSITRTLAATLKKMGVTGLRSFPHDRVEVLRCWAQAIPVARDSKVPELTPTTPILFEVPSASLTEIVTEMLRLGNDRQTYQAFVRDDADASTTLLRVVGPPYYTLLRAIDHLASADGSQVRAFREVEKNVWVEIGYQHPLMGQFRLPDKQLLLISPERSWTFLPADTFKDIYEILDFRFPDEVVEWQSGTLPGKLEVPLRLIAGSESESAELWVIRVDAMNRFDSVVRDITPQQLDRYLFAVANSATGEPLVVVRSRPGKSMAAPLSIVGAIAYRPYWKLPNLFVPLGRRLHPLVRRDTLRRLLCEDPGQIVWLVPHDIDGFIPEIIPDEAFRPLDQWVEFVIQHDRETLGKWISRVSFDFESFICASENDRSAKPPTSPKGSRESKDGKNKGNKTGTATQGQTNTFTSVDVAETISSAGIEEAESTVLRRDEWQERRETLEEAFLSEEGSLDSSTRQALWPQLAEVYSALGEPSEAALAWSYAAWEVEKIPAIWWWNWLQSEQPGCSREITPESVDQLLEDSAPNPQHLRILIATMLWGISKPESRVVLIPKTVSVMNYLHKHERWIGTRLMWLVGSKLTQLKGADPLALARIRDRLLNRLLDEGLSSARDLPNFMRFAGLKQSVRVRQVRERLNKLHELMLRWIDIPQVGSSELTMVNRCYANLIFAFGLARLGETSAASNLMESSSTKLVEHDRELAKRAKDPKNKSATDPDAHTYLVELFHFRIEQALQAKPFSGSFPQPLIHKLEALRARGKSRMSVYVIDRMMVESMILLPQDKFDPYRAFKEHKDPLYDRLKELSQLSAASFKPAAFEELYHQYLNRAEQIPGDNQSILLTEFASSARKVSEAFSLKLIDRILVVLSQGLRSREGLPLERSYLLIEQAMYLAAHYDRRDHLRKLIEMFESFIKSAQGSQLTNLINYLARQCLRNLRRFGAKEEIELLWSLMETQLLKVHPLENIRNLPSKLALEHSQALIHVATGWLVTNQWQRGMPYLEEARQLLISLRNVLLRPENRGFIKDYVDLTRAYVHAVGNLPVDDALNRLEELFEKMAPVPNSFTTAGHYSRFHLNIVEDVVLAVVNEEFTLGAERRDWQDEDEYLVRRRIHRDMRMNLLENGIKAD
jgi:cellulose synthase operon protein C